jgi:hypothetical protein
LEGLGARIYNQLMRNLTILLAVLLSSTISQAKLFQNSYVQFELPDRWECKLEGTEYVCSPLQTQQSKEVIFILTAKEVGPSDSLEAYEAHLKAPKTIPSASGKPTVSTIKSLDKRQYNGHPWIDSMHLGSEIPQYYTRYLATTKDRLAILVTFSAHQLHFTKYSADILKAVQSLQVKANFNLGNSQTGAGTGGGSSGVIGPPVQGGASDMIEEFPTEPKSKNTNKLIALFLLIAAVGAYLFIRKRKKKSDFSD